MANLQVGVAGNGTVTVGAGASVHSPASNILTLGTDGDERLRINSSGYIGVNDTSGNARFIISGDSDDGDHACQLRIYDTDSTAGSQIPSLSFWGGSTEIGRIRGSDTSGMKFYTADSGTLGDRMTITADGTVGINTDNTGGNGLGVMVDSSNTNVLATGGIALNLKNKNSTDDTWVAMDFNNSAGGIVGRFGAQFKDTSDKSTDLYFATRADGGSLAERMRIDYNGDVIIGSTSSTAVTGGATPFQVSGSDGYTGMSIIRTASAGAQLQFAAGSNGDNVSDNDGLGYIKFFGYHTNGYDEYARIHAEVDGTPGDGDAPGALVFATTADGASSVTERMRITPGGYVKVASIPSFKVSIGSRDSINSAQYIAEDNGWTLVTTRDGFNTGSHFNEADGKFTAPVAGLYHFGFSIMRNGSNPGGTANPDIRIKKNNALMWARGYWAEYDTNYQTTQCHTLTTLAVNDYVQFHIGNTASVYDDDSYMYGFFVG